MFCRVVVTSMVKISVIRESLCDIKHRSIGQHGQPGGPVAGDFVRIQDRPGRGHVAAIDQAVGERAAVVRGSGNAEPAQMMRIVAPVVDLEGQRLAAAARVQVRGGFEHRHVVHVVAGVGPTLIGVVRSRR